MEINNKKILICNCEATMDIDDEALSKACKLESKCKIHNNLCGSELDVVLDRSTLLCASKYPVEPDGRPKEPLTACVMFDAGAFKSKTKLGLDKRRNN